MIVPVELQTTRPMHLSDGEVSTTKRVWDVLMASRDGDVDRFRELTADQPSLVYAQYNYTPPIYFAVREGHAGLVSHLLGQGALDPSYRTYPFLDTLSTFAVERGYDQIAELLRLYPADPKRHRYAGDNGEIDYDRTPAELAFQTAVGAGDIAAVERSLAEDPSLPLDPTYHWGEGILLFPAKSGNWKLLELLPLGFAARWGNLEMVRFLLENGANPERSGAAGSKPVAWAHRRGHDGIDEILGRSWPST